MSGRNIQSSPLRISQVRIATLNSDKLLRTTIKSNIRRTIFTLCTLYIHLYVSEYYSHFKSSINVNLLNFKKWKCEFHALDKRRAKSGPSATSLLPHLHTDQRTLWHSPDRGDVLREASDSHKYWRAIGDSCERNDRLFGITCARRIRQVHAEVDRDAWSAAKDGRCR